ncbi:DoxX family protein [Desulfobacterota bacterium AH_259_B03_O07]|nr:DoxX family protein [Desulfobacterota bacterium AH_259_B03_O07]
MITLVILLGTYIFLALFRVKKVLRGNISLTVLLFFTGTAHFYKTQEMSMMLPDYISYKIEIIYITGVLELLGAIGILISKIQRFTGICLILMFVGFLPANIYGAFNHVDFGGHIYGPKYLLFRIPLQLFFIWWTYRYTIKLPKKG